MDCGINYPHDAVHTAVAPPRHPPVRPAGRASRKCL